MKDEKEIREDVVSMIEDNSQVSSLDLYEGVQQIAWDNGLEIEDILAMF